MSPPLSLSLHRGPGRHRGRRAGRLFRALCCLPLHCESSDPIWEAYSETRSWSLRCMLVPVFRSAQAAAIVPPPPGRLRSLQALVFVLLAVASNAAAQMLLFDHIHDVLQQGFQLKLHAYILENLTVNMQLPVILLVSWANLGRAAPVLGAVMATSSPLRPAPSFVVVTALIFLSHVASQVLFYVTVFSDNDDLICFAVAAAWSGFCALVMDRIVSIALTLAALKIRVVNQRLASLYPTTTMAAMPGSSPTHTVQRGLLQSVANRWEATMEQVSALLGHDMLGLPLLYSLLQMSIGLVTSTAQAVEETTQACIRLYKLFDVLMYLTRVASLAVTAGWLYREAKETETILGALDTTAWPIRERHRVKHLLRRSRETAQFRVCGIVRLDHGLLFTIMGNTVTFMVMLLQLPILTPGKAAEKQNQTEQVAAAAGAA